ncbi:MAG: hypothetical protein ACTH6H_01150, partial [Serratia sp. (in: enterobacteria)]
MSRIATQLKKCGLKDKRDNASLGFFTLTTSHHSPARATGCILLLLNVNIPTAFQAATCKATGKHSGCAELSLMAVSDDGTTLFEKEYHRNE